MHYLPAQPISMPVLRNRFKSKPARLTRPSRWVKARMGASGLQIELDSGIALKVSPSIHPHCRPGDRVEALLARDKVRDLRIIGREAHRAIGLTMGGNQVCPLASKADFRLAMDFFTTRRRKRGQEPQPCYKLTGGNLQDGEMVEVAFQPWKKGDDTRLLRSAKLVARLGSQEDPDVARVAALMQRAVPTVWPEAVLQECKVLKSPSEMLADGSQHTQFSLPWVTIDGDEARDYDDAVWCERDKKGWHLMVAIADVSRYLEMGSALDQEARKRGNSIYLPGQWVPMLPNILSADYCSLTPDQERATVVCDMRISPTGNLQSVNHMLGWIRSCARLTYGEVNAWMQGSSSGAWPVGVEDSLSVAHSLAAALRQKRFEHGGIALNLQRWSVATNAQGRPTGLYPESVPSPEGEAPSAEQLIEEAMLVANKATASVLHKRGRLATFRSHPQPTESDWNALMRELSLILDRDLEGIAPSGAGVQKVLNQVAGRKDEDLINLEVLRTLGKAQYCSQPAQHFALASDCYAHFTSPIRRYADLALHRILLDCLGLRPLDGSGANLSESSAVDEICEACNTGADKATETERQVSNHLKCLLARKSQGQTIRCRLEEVNYAGVRLLAKQFDLTSFVPAEVCRRQGIFLDPQHQRLAWPITSRSGRQQGLRKGLSGRASRSRKRFGKAPVRSEQWLQRGGDCQMVLEDVYPALGSIRLAFPGLD